MALDDVGSDGKILYVYEVEFIGGQYRIKEVPGSFVNGPPTDPDGVAVSETINDGPGDSTVIIGDIAGEAFSVSGATQSPAINGSYSFVSGASLAGIGNEGSNIDFGFIGQKSGGGLYFFSETPVTLAGPGDSENSADNRRLELTSDTQAICFMAGTAVAVPGGSQLVETLSIGDTVLTHDGRAVAVTWIGRQTVRSYFVDETRLPVRIKAHALGENVPVRDLVVSPDHAIHIDGVLAHAGALINGRSIVRETKVPDVFTYYHVETADHSLILAENVPAETFIDNVDRAAFDNWDEFQRLYPQGREVAELDYPRAKSARQLPARIVAHLNARASLIDAVPAKVA